ncbi:MAG: methionyl-tRNA formyltransferase [Fimbriimonadaceae bacterium]
MAGSEPGESIILRIVYFGTADFAVPALRAVSDHVTLVVSQPDRPKGRGLKMQLSPVKAAALELGLRVETPEKSRSPEFREILEAENADIFLVAAYGQILSQAVLDIPRRGCINLHGSLLPKWRGAAPIQRAIEAGDTETGVTLMQMDRGMDTGDMIAIKRIAIGPDDTAGVVYDSLAHLAGEMALDWMPKIAVGNYERIPQDNSLATMAPKVDKSEAEITSDLDLKSAYDRFRAFTPAPGAFVVSELGQIKLHRIRPVAGAVGELGCLTESDGEIFVAIKGGGLRLEEFQLEGRKRVLAAEFLNGARLSPGMRFLR